ncbi:MAG: hypothetical protein GY838_12875 [bacterium]|nr:hypothetical protein [bacterium]
MTTTKTKWKRNTKGEYASSDGRWIIRQPGPNWAWRLLRVGDRDGKIIAADRCLAEVKRRAEKIQLT